MKTETETLILGCGYLGNFYLKNHPNSLCTKRNISDFETEKIKPFYFNLYDKESWKNIPDAENILWTFPAATDESNSKEALEFYKSCLRNKKVIVISSTSAYVSKIENEIVNEDYEIKLNEPRFFAEELLRKEGALILTVSGIIGPHRLPLNWYKKNLVVYAQNILNYIHVDDIVFFVNKLFEKFISQERYNLTSQDYKTHEQILNDYINHNLIDSNAQFHEKIGSKNSKKIDCKKLLNYCDEKLYVFKGYL